MRSGVALVSIQEGFAQQDLQLRNGLIRPTQKAANEDHFPGHSTRKSRVKLGL
jgi:hypothetical protein